MCSVMLQRMTIAEILEHEWFREDYKPPRFEQDDDVNLDDVDAVFSNNQVTLYIYKLVRRKSRKSLLTELKYNWLYQELLVTERIEKPVSMNAFELISRSEGFSLENLFNKQTVCN